MMKLLLNLMKHIVKAVICLNFTLYVAVLYRHKNISTKITMIMSCATQQ